MYSYNLKSICSVCKGAEQAGQRQKDSNERLSIEQTKLKKIDDNVKTLQQITASQSGARIKPCTKFVVKVTV